MSNKQMKIEMMYNNTKRSMMMAYVIGAVLGSIGIHYLYIGDKDFFAGMLGLAVLSFIVPFVSVVWACAILISFVHTYFSVKKANDKIRMQCELMFDGE